MSEKITKEFINSLKTKREEIIYGMANIKERVDYIVRKNGEIFGYKIESWDYNTKTSKIYDGLDYEDMENDIFDFDNEDDIVVRCYILITNGSNGNNGTVGSYICIGRGNDGSNFGQMSVKLKDGRYFSLASHFPYRFLFEDFEEEVKNGKELYEKENKESLKIAKEKELVNLKKYISFIKEKENYSKEEWNNIVDYINSLGT